MGYYHITFCPVSLKLFTIVLPWGKYEYQKLPMGLCNSPDIFQAKMNGSFNGLEYVRAHIDNLLIISNGNFEDQLNKVKTVLKKLKVAGIKVNAEKSFFARDKLEYLGFTQETFLVYPYFSKPFVIHTDVSKVQLGAVIRTLNPA